MTIKRLVLYFFVMSMLSSPLLFAIDNLKLNSRLDYTSDSLDGPLITGDDAQSGFVAGKPNYVVIYGEGCFNSKRQARRTVDLYSKYRSKVHFVVIDLEVQRSPEQQKLVKQYYKGYIPHVLVLDARGEALYNLQVVERFGVPDGIWLCHRLLSALRSTSRFGGKSTYFHAAFCADCSRRRHRRWSPAMRVSASAGPPVPAT